VPEVKKPFLSLCSREMQLKQVFRQQTPFRTTTFFSSARPCALIFPGRVDKQFVDDIKLTTNADWTSRSLNACV